MFCTKCGAENEDNNAFCTNCGEKLVTNNTGSQSVASNSGVFHTHNSLFHLCLKIAHGGIRAFALIGTFLL